MSVLDALFGAGSDLTALQMTLRAAAIFLITVAMLRAAGRRAYGQRRSIDTCTVVLLGAVLSRAVVGASPFWPTLCAGACIVVLHRLLAMACIRWPRFDALISGGKRELLRDGMPDRAEMRRALITEQDLHEAVRKKTGDERTPIVRAVLERDGSVTVAAADSASSACIDGCTSTAISYACRALQPSRLRNSTAKVSIHASRLAPLSLNGCAGGASAGCAGRSIETVIVGTPGLRGDDVAVRCLRRAAYPRLRISPLAAASARRSRGSTRRRRWA